jgi:hypothetical protein
MVMSLSSTVVSPEPGLIVWACLLACLVLAGVVTGAKGRPGWVLIGVLTGGMPWLITAFLPARPGSWWERVRRVPTSNQR